MDRPGAEVEEALAVDGVGQLRGHQVEDEAFGIEAPLRVDEHADDGPGAVMAAVAVLGQAEDGRADVGTVVDRVEVVEVQVRKEQIDLEQD